MALWAWKIIYLRKFSLKHKIAISEAYSEHFSEMRSWKGDLNCILMQKCRILYLSTGKIGFLQQQLVAIRENLGTNCILTLKLKNQINISASYTKTFHVNLFTKYNFYYYGNLLWGTGWNSHVGKEFNLRSFQFNTRGASSIYTRSISSEILYQNYDPDRSLFWRIERNPFHLRKLNLYLKSQKET